MGFDLRVLSLELKTLNKNPQLETIYKEQLRDEN